MTQDPDLVHFTVADGEQVTITVTSVGFAGTTSAQFPVGTNLIQVSSPPDVYQFTASRSGASGAAQAEFLCSCLFTGAPPFSKYTFQLTGSKGGSFTAPPAYRVSQDITYNLSFEIH
jgi:hypothetical protein